METLQEELLKTYSWADLNNANFNCDKFEASRFKKMARNKTEEVDPAYTAYNGDPIPFKDNIKDLGVWMSANLSFDEHIRIITAKARQVSGMILRSFKSRKTSVLLPLLKSLVRSKVEYACPIWNPTDSTNINRLENIQRQFTSKFQRFREYDAQLDMTICNVSYGERLKQLKLYSLQRRRERYVIIYMHKIKLGLVPNPCFEFTYNRTNKFEFKPRTDRKNGRYSFFVMGPRLYNSLPAKLRELDDNPYPEAKDVNDFKKDLDAYLTLLRDEPGTQANSLLYVRPGAVTR